ncbi:MAG: sugar ABC transporter ATP-binding protein [Planctomycetaceae bacterium]
MSTARAMIQVCNLTKSYDGVHALSDVNLDLHAAEIHALCGENGAGKSTLIKILSGIIKPDSGRIMIHGTDLNTGSVHASEAAGIAVMHQESMAFPHLNAVENLFVGREITHGRGLFLNHAAMKSQTEKLLLQLGVSLNLKVPVGELPLAQRQMVALARAISRDCRLLIMDEPTASLSNRETQTLLRIVRQLQTSGVTVLYVSHRLEEIFQVADRVTVLRDGRHVATHQIADVDRSHLIRDMVGRSVDEQQRAGSHAADESPVVLDVRQLTRRGVFRDVTFRIRAGEILGLTGLVGAGRSEIARAIFGVDEFDEGEVRVAGRLLSGGSVQEAMAAGIGMVPEDRQHEGLILPMSVGENISLAMLQLLTRWGLVLRHAEQQLVAAQIENLSVKAANPRIPAATLSGGNQQKLVLGKWLARNPKVLILDEPTRGVDVGAKSQVHQLVRTLAAQGLATLVISSDLPELLSLCDRMLVLQAGRIAGELQGAAATQEAVLALALPDATDSILQEAWP